MASYRKHILVKQEDIDQLQHVNNVRYLEWVQEISKEHWENVVDKKVLGEMIWVVRNHNITYYESALLHDSLEITTEILQWKGPISIRLVTMTNNKTDKMLVRAITEWCAVHPQTLRPMRVPADIQALFTNENEKMA